MNKEKLKFEQFDNVNNQSLIELNNTLYQIENLSKFVPKQLRENVFDTINPVILHNIGRIDKKESIERIDKNINDFINKDRPNELNVNDLRSMCYLKEPTIEKLKKEGKLKSTIDPEIYFNTEKKIYFVKEKK